MPRSRISAEAALKRELSGALKLEFSVLRSAEGLLAELATSIAEAGSDANHIAIASLLSRTCSDVRAMQLLLERGYSLQALTVGASAYEHLTTAAHIGSSVEYGRDWCDHDDPFHTNSPNSLGPKIRERRGNYAYVTVTKGNGRETDAVYTLLCCAKHGNPLLQETIDLATSPDTHYLSASPHLSPGTMRQAELAAYAVMRGVVQMLNVIVDERVVATPDSRDAQSFLAHAKLLDQQWSTNRRRPAS